MSTYKYIHLTNGDHIFTELHFPKEKTGFFKLKKPLKLTMKEDENHVHFGFMPWIPFSDDEEVPLQAKSVITMANLSDEYKSLYIRITSIMKSIIAVAALSALSAPGMPVCPHSVCSLPAL